MVAKPDLGEFDRLVADGHVGKSKPCGVRVVLDTLDLQDRVNLEAALACPQSEYPAAAIMAWAARRGRELNAVSIGCHRRGKCSCARRRDA